MRVLHIGKYYAPQRGGIERHVQDLAEWQVRHGLEVGVLVHQARGQWRNARASVNGVDVRRAGCLAAPLYTPLSPALPWLLRSALTAARPDVLHLHLPNPSCLAVLASPRARALPWVVHWHADASGALPSPALRLAYRAYRPVEQALLARAQAIIATSRAYLDASTALSEWRSKARVVPLGIGADAVMESGPPAWPGDEDAPRILAVGRLSHYKGFNVLLDALARIPRARLMLVGEGECAEALHAQARQLAIGDRVAFVQGLGDDALRAAYARADVFVLPSLDRSEAFGLVLLEAMRAGVPVIASDVRGSGIGHVVADGKTGLLVPPADAGVLADALERLLADPALREQFGRAGQQRWRDEFSLDRSARAVLDVYLDALR